MDDLQKQVHGIAQILNDISVITLHLHFFSLFIINSTKTPKTEGAVKNAYKLLEFAAGLMTPLAKR